MRASCGSCTREARYSASGWLLCARHAQAVAHAGLALETVGTCGHVAPVADMVARRPCPYCQALIDDGDAPEKAAYWVSRMTAGDAPGN